jgi:hypothetical protein
VRRWCTPRQRRGARRRPRLSLCAERRFRTTRGGTIRQGSLVRAQSFTGRPHPECASGTTPIEGLYLGGGSVHPGVPGTLAGGYNAARAVCEGQHLERWWTDPPFTQQARDAGLLPEPALMR